MPNKKEMQRALMLIDGLCHLAMDPPPNVDIQPLVSDIYKISHSASGLCGNPHTDWVSGYETISQRLKEMKICDVEKELAGSTDSVLYRWPFGKK